MMSATSVWQEQADLSVRESVRRVLICLLGPFCIFTQARLVTARGATKTAAFFCALAIRPSYSASRDALLHTLWPDVEAELARQSLNSLVYCLHKSLRDALDGATPVLYDGENYSLNTEAGIDLDVARFDELFTAANRKAQAGSPAAAAALYNQAVALYRGDLCIGFDIQTVIERERLRAQYLSLLAQLADYHYSAASYDACLQYAHRLLANDPCREDAHRLVMRCYVRRGERSQALHQYLICEQILRSQFDAAPEPASKALYDQARLTPESV